MEYMQGGSLKSLMHSIGGLPEKVVANITKKVLECLLYFHKKNETYGGISTSQVLFTKAGTIKFGLGLSQRLNNQSSTEKSDVYSLGLLILQSFLGDCELIPSFTTDCCILHSLESHPIISRLTSQVKEFLCLCLRQDLARPSVEELIKHD